MSFFKHNHIKKLILKSLTTFKKVLSFAEEKVPHLPLVSKDHFHIYFINKFIITDILILIENINFLMTCFL